MASDRTPENDKTPWPTSLSPKIERMCVPIRTLDEFLKYHRKKQSHHDENLPLKVQEDEASPSNDEARYDFNHHGKNLNLVRQNVKNKPVVILFAHICYIFLRTRTSFIPFSYFDMGWIME